MFYEVTVAGALVALLAAVGTAVWVGLWVARRRGARARLPAASPPVVAAVGAGPASTRVSADDPSAGRPDMDEQSRLALNACMFAPAPVDHLCWTAMVVDPALHDTPSHIRLVGHYESEVAATDAAAHLVDALNECLIPGEAPLTATALGIEPAPAPSAGYAITHQAEPVSHEPLSHEPLSHIGRPIAYSGTPLAGHTVLTDLDGAPLRR